MPLLTRIQPSRPSAAPQPTVAGPQPPRTSPALKTLGTVPEGRQPTPMVWGFRRTLALAGLCARVVWIALRFYRSPLRAVRALARWRASGISGWGAGKTSVTSGRVFASLYAPGWPSRAFDGFVARELDRLDPVLGRPPGLRTAVVAITRMCGLRCEHCVEWDVLNTREQLSAADLREIVQRIRACGVAQVFFSGGEPLQRFRDLLDLTATLADETDVWVVSSGRGLTREKAQRLRMARLTGVALSLDHWDSAAHDRFRGREGTFDAVRTAAANAVDAGLVLALWLCPVRAFVSPANLRRYALAPGQLHPGDGTEAGRPLPRTGRRTRARPIEGVGRVHDVVEPPSGRARATCRQLRGLLGAHERMPGRRGVVRIRRYGRLATRVPVLPRASDPADLRGAGCPTQHHPHAGRIPQ
jgi:pyruvate-formate lyase-activating enzyme